jgi:hypothetical protein
MNLDAVYYTYLIYGGVIVVGSLIGFGITRNWIWVVIGLCGACFMLLTNASVMDLYLGFLIGAVLAPITGIILFFAKRSLPVGNLTLYRAMLCATGAALIPIISTIVRMVHLVLRG